MYKCVAKHGNIEAQFKVGFAYECSFSEPNYAEAFKWYSMAAKNSHKEAMYHLDLLFEHGLGISQDYHQANQLYEQAYQLGSDDALHRLAVAYHHGKGVDNDTAKAMEYYILSAELGNPEYQCEVGRLYEEGELVQQDLLKALKWYTAAYAQGYDSIESKLCAMYEDNRPYEKLFYKKLLRNLSIASFNYFGLNKSYMFDDFGRINNRLGLLYFYGLGTNKNLKQAFEYFSKGYSDTKDKMINHFNFLIYNGFSVNLKNEILSELETNEEIINQIEPDKLYALGMIYYDGIVQKQNNSDEYYPIRYTPTDQDPNDPAQCIVIEKHHLKAFTYLKMAADKKCYEAVREPVLFHYSRDAEKENIQGEQYFGFETNIYDIVLKSNATPHTMQDFSKTIEWCKYLECVLAKDKGMHEMDKTHINLQLQLSWAYLYEYGYGVKQDYKKAMEYYKILTDKGFRIGYFRLGLMYYYGKGVSVDYEKSFGIFEKVDFSSEWPRKLIFMYDQNDLHITGFQKKKMISCTKTTDEVKSEIYYYLSLMCKYGQGIPKNDNKAQEYFIEALYQGYHRAINEIANEHF